MQDECDEVHHILESYGLERDARDHVIAALERNPAKWADWMMRFELRLEKPEPGRAFGYGKGRFTGVNPAKSALRPTLIGGLAAGVAYAVAKLFTA